MRVSSRKRLSRRNGSLRRKVSLFASGASLALGGCAEVGDEHENVSQHSQAMMNEAAEGARPKRDEVILPAAEHLSDIERFWDQAVLPPLALQEIAMHAHRVQMSSAHFRKWLHLHADFIRHAKGNGEVAAGLREAYRAQILRLGAAVPTHKSVARFLAFASSQKSYSQGAPGRPPPDEASINDFAPLAEQLMLNIERTLATGAAPDQGSVAELAYVVELFQTASLQTFEAHRALRPGEWDLGPAISVDPILTANLAYLRQTTKRFFDLLVLARDGRAHAASERVAPGLSIRRAAPKERAEKLRDLGEGTWFVRFVNAKKEPAILTFTRDRNGKLVPAALSAFSSLDESNEPYLVLEHSHGDFAHGTTSRSIIVKLGDGILQPVKGRALLVSIDTASASITSASSADDKGRLYDAQFFIPFNVANGEQAKRAFIEQAQLQGLKLSQDVNGAAIFLPWTNRDEFFARIEIIVQLLSKSLSDVEARPLLGSLARMVVKFEPAMSAEQQSAEARAEKEKKEKAELKVATPKASKGKAKAKARKGPPPRRDPFADEKTADSAASASAATTERASEHEQATEFAAREIDERDAIEQDRPENDQARADSDQAIDERHAIDEEDGPEDGAYRPWVGAADGEENVRGEAIDAAADIDQRARRERIEAMRAAVREMIPIEGTIKPREMSEALDTVVAMWFDAKDKNEGRPTQHGSHRSRHFPEVGAITNAQKKPIKASQGRQRLGEVIDRFEAADQRMARRKDQDG